MPEIDAHIPGMNAVSFVAYCAQLAGLPPWTRCSAPTRCSTTWAGRSQVPERRNLLDGMKAAHQAGPGLVHDPDLLFLDEPTNGMDPKGREEMLELIRDLARTQA